MRTFTCSCSWFYLYFSSLIYTAFLQTSFQRAAKHPVNLRTASIQSRGIHKENIYHKKGITVGWKLQRYRSTQNEQDTQEMKNMSSKIHQTVISDEDADMK